MKSLKNNKNVIISSSPDYSSGIEIPSGSNPPRVGFVLFSCREVTNGYSHGFINGVEVNRLGSSGYQIGTKGGVYPVSPDDVVSADSGAKIIFLDIKS